LEFKTIIARDVFTETTLLGMGLNERQIKAVQYIKKYGKITNREFKTKLGVPNRTALRDLSELCAKGILDKVGLGRSAQYVFGAKHATITP
jgi:ATP-dependent DNA helicase RecG